MLQSRGPKDWVKYVVASSKVPSKPGLSSPKIFRAARFFEYRYKLWRRLAASGSDARGRRLSIGGRALGRSGRRAVGRGLLVGRDVAHQLNSFCCKLFG
jgi:hypothetical protein